MKRDAMVVFGLIVAGSLLSAGRAQAAEAGPKAGTWVINYEWSKGGKWSGQTVLKKKGDLTYSGHTDWESADGENSGREDFEAIYDPRAKTMTLVAKSVKAKKGALVAGTYVGTVSEEGKEITDGKWSHPDHGTGTWTASWKKK